MVPAARLAVAIAVLAIIGVVLATLSITGAFPQLGAFGVGMVAAFVSAFIVIRWLIRYVATHDFKPFAWYRILAGTGALIWLSLR